MGTYACKINMHIADVTFYGLTDGDLYDFKPIVFVLPSEDDVDVVGL